MSLGALATLALAACSSRQPPLNSSDILLRAGCYSAGTARSWRLQIASTGRYSIERATNPGWAVASSGTLRRNELHVLEATIARSGYCEIDALQKPFTCDDVATYELAARCESSLLAFDFDQCLRASPERTSIRRIFATLQGLVPGLARWQECSFVPP